MITMPKTMTDDDHWWLDDWLLMADHWWVMIDYWWLIADDWWLIVDDRWLIIITDDDDDDDEEDGHDASFCHRPGDTTCWAGIEHTAVVFLTPPWHFWGGCRSILLRSPSWAQQGNSDWAVGQRASLVPRVWPFLRGKAMINHGLRTTIFWGKLRRIIMVNHVLDFGPYFCWHTWM